MGDFIRAFTENRMVSVVLEELWDLEKWYKAKLFCALHYVKHTNSGKIALILFILAAIAVFFVVRSTRWHSRHQH